MLDHLDTLLSFVVIISGLSVVVTTLTQMVSAALGLRGSNLRWGLKTLIEQLDPGLKDHATTLSERVLQHPLISDSSFSGFDTRFVTRWKLASTIRKEELLEILHRLSTGDGDGGGGGMPLTPNHGASHCRARSIASTARRSSSSSPGSATPGRSRRPAGPARRPSRTWSRGPRCCPRTSTRGSGR